MESSDCSPDEVWELASYAARNYRKTHDKALAGDVVGVCLHSRVSKLSQETAQV